MQSKLELLRQKLLGHENMAVAFSGGVDSTFLLLCAKNIFGDDLLAVTALAPNFDPDEIAQTKKICEEHEIRHLIINLGTDLLNEIAHNPEDRCYICKKSIFSNLRSTLDELGFDALADGTNLDDAKDYRPGQRALDELGVISPLRDAGFTKQDIRLGLKAMNVDIWDKPAYACLASRVPYGEEITLEKLNAIHQAEAALRNLGFPQVRVRHHGDVARIEVPPTHRSRFFDEAFMDLVNEVVKKAGFKYASLDLGGYVMGNLNQGLGNQPVKKPVPDNQTPNPSNQTPRKE